MQPSAQLGMDPEFYELCRYLAEECFRIAEILDEDDRNWFEHIGETLVSITRRAEEGCQASNVVTLNRGP